MYVEQVCHIADVAYVADVGDSAAMPALACLWMTHCTANIVVLRYKYKNVPHSPNQ
jgi:hypothetical protein